MLVYDTTGLVLLLKLIEELPSYQFISTIFNIYTACGLLKEKSSPNSHEFYVINLRVLVNNHMVKSLRLGC